MTTRDETMDATQRVDDAQRLIRDATAARQKNEKPPCAVDDEINRTRAASEMLSSLALLIAGIYDAPGA